MFLESQPGAITELATGQCWSGRELMACAVERAHRFFDAGLRRGDRMFIHHGNNLEFFADLLAAWHLGASVVPIDDRLTPFEIENLARAVNPRLLLVDSTTDGALLAALRALGIKVADTLEFEGVRAGAPRLGRLHCGAALDDEALILFTSGSTGTPKGVVHTHRSLRARWLFLRDCLGIEAYRRTLCLLPTHFGHGLICNSLFPCLAGQELVIAPAFNTAALMRLGAVIDEQQITFLSSVPSMWGLVLKASPPPRRKTLRRIHCGSAPLSGHLWKQIQEWSGTREVFNAYGITETGSWVAGTSVGDFVPEDGLVGAPWGAVIKILKDADRGAPFDPDAQCPADEPGCVWLNTPALMRGYHGQPELTEQVVSGGWFCTGDIGLVDGRGWLYLKGREREEINKGGAKIYPADIEAVVEAFDRTKGACAFAVDDALYGQNVALAVVLESEDEATIRQLYDWMKQRLAEFKMPIRWYLLAALPRNSRGKIGRKEVVELCAHQPPLAIRRILQSR